MDTRNAEILTARLLLQWPPAARAARSVLRAWERFRVAARSGAEPSFDWDITRTRQHLPSSQFRPSAVEIIDAAASTDRLFAIHRRTGIALAAAAFDLSGGSDGAPLVRELALAHTGGNPEYGPLDPRAYQAAVFLLERLHDRAAKLKGPTHIWSDPCAGATLEDLVRLGFEHRGFSASPALCRPDTASSEQMLAKLWNLWHLAAAIVRR